MIRSLSFPLCVLVGLSFLTHASAQSDWVQAHAVISYQRTGTASTAMEGSFTYRLEATLDQVMERVKATRRGGEPSYFPPSDAAPVLKLSGTQSLTAELTQADATTHKTYRASADLKGALTTADNLQLMEIKPVPEFGVGYSAKFTVDRAVLKGSVSSSYPRMNGTAEENSILLWPTPIAYSAEEGFAIHGDIQLFPVLGPRPTKSPLDILYDGIAGSDDLPGIGALRLPAIGAVTVRQGDTWVIQFKKTKNFDTLTGGKYTDTVSIEIRLVPRTLPDPKPNADAH